mmetsp:Transcript_13998/g.33598  ORF Transcript_13998/g.33598 Transcript_13998/m.33598 type:complete len:782 (+) Transcript_13998:771-3116(+)
MNNKIEQEDEEEEEEEEEQQQDCRRSIMTKVPIMNMKVRMMVIMLLFVVVVVIQRSAMTIPSSSTDADADDVSGWSLFTVKNDHHASFVCHSHESATSSKRYDAPAAIPLCDDVIQALTDSFPGIDLQYADDVQQQKKKNLALFKGSRRQEASLSRRVLLSSVESESETMPDLSSCGEERNDNTWILTINILGSLFCISFMALASGLFLGFMTLDPLSLRIKIRASVDTEEREYCTKLLPVVENQHRLLVTLLIVDAIAYEALPLFVDKLVPSWAAVLLSVTFLLVFGEILPSAVITGPDQLRLASELTPLMTFFLWFLWPFAGPLTWLLDTLVPHDDSDETEAYNRGELSALIKIQLEDRQNKGRVVTSGLTPHTGRLRSSINDRQLRQEMQDAHKQPSFRVPDQSRGWRKLKREIMEAVEQRHLEQQEQQQQQNQVIIDGDSFQLNGNASRHHRRTSSFGSHEDSVHSHSTPPAYEQMAPPLHQAEVRVVEGALKMRLGCAWDVYTPLRQIFTLPSNLQLDRNVIADIYSEGYSRVPVYDPLPPPNQHRKYAVRGVLMVRQLIMIDWADKRPVDSLPLYTPPCVSPRMNLVDLLQILQKGGSHIAFVCAGPDLANTALEDGKPIPIQAGFMGLVTLEDVLEAILQDRIYDEEDIAERVMAGATLTQWAKKIQRFYRKRRQSVKNSSIVQRRDVIHGSRSTANDRSSSEATNGPIDSAPAIKSNRTKVSESISRMDISDLDGSVEGSTVSREQVIPEDFDLEVGQGSGEPISEKTPLIKP